jgi:hypothetical protein
MHRKNSQLSKPFASRILRHAKITHLRIAVSQPHSLRIAITNVLPAFKHVQILTVILQIAHPLPDGRRPDRVTHMNSFHDVLIQIDEVCSVRGKKILFTGDSKEWVKGSGKYGTTTGWKLRNRDFADQIWEWSAEKRERKMGVLVMKSTRKHVKFVRELYVTLSLARIARHIKSWHGRGSLYARLGLGGFKMEIR